MHCSLRIRISHPHTSSAAASCAPHRMFTPSHATHIHISFTTLALQPEDPHQPSAHLVRGCVAQWRDAMLVADECAGVRASEQGGIGGGGGVGGGGIGGVDAAGGSRLLDFRAQERDRAMGELTIRCGVCGCGWNV